MESLLVKTRSESGLFLALKALTFFLFPGLNHTGFSLFKADGIQFLSVSPYSHQAKNGGQKTVPCAFLDVQSNVGPYKPSCWSLVLEDRQFNVLWTRNNFTLRTFQNWSLSTATLQKPLQTNASFRPPPPERTNLTARFSFHQYEPFFFPITSISLRIWNMFYLQRPNYESDSVLST